MKNLFLLLVLTASFSISQAQIRYGAKGGLNISKIGGDNKDDYKSKMGFHIGVLAQIPVLSNFSVQPEALFSTQGAKWEDDANDITRLSYVNIPVLAKYTSPYGFFAETGPQIGFLTSAKYATEGHKEDIREYLKKTDFSWAFGLGYNITPNIGVSGRYNLGLSEMYDGEKNNVIQFGVFYLLESRRK